MSNVSVPSRTNTKNAPSKVDSSMKHLLHKGPSMSNITQDTPNLRKRPADVGELGHTEWWKRYPGTWAPPWKIRRESVNFVQEENTGERATYIDQEKARAESTIAMNAEKAREKRAREEEHARKDEARIEEVEKEKARQKEKSRKEEISRQQEKARQHEKARKVEKARQEEISREEEKARCEVASTEECARKEAVPQMERMATEKEMASKTAMEARKQVNHTMEQEVFSENLTANHESTKADTSTSQDTDKQAEHPKDVTILPNNEKQSNDVHDISSKEISESAVPITIEEISNTGITEETHHAHTEDHSIMYISDDDTIQNGGISTNRNRVIIEISDEDEDDLQQNTPIGTILDHQKNEQSAESQLNTETEKDTSSVDQISELFDGSNDSDDVAHNHEECDSSNKNIANSAPRVQEKAVSSTSVFVSAVTKSGPRPIADASSDDGGREIYTKNVPCDHTNHEHTHLSDDNNVREHTSSSSTDPRNDSSQTELINETELFVGSAENINGSQNTNELCSTQANDEHSNSASKESIKSILRAFQGRKTVTGTQLLEALQASKKEFLPLQCPICKNLISSDQTMEDHMKTHTKEKEFKCTICPKSYANKDKWIDHMRTHTDSSMYQCPICQKTLSSKLNLDYHIGTHSGEKSYQCDICGKYLVSRSTLADHMGTHAEVKPYKCPICPMRVASKFALNRHYRSHVEEKPQCPVCEKRFTSKTKLADHMYLHTGDSPHKCLICQKRFTAKDKLKKHEKLHFKT